MALRSCRFATFIRVRRWLGCLASGGGVGTSIGSSFFFLRRSDWTAIYYESECGLRRFDIFLITVSVLGCPGDIYFFLLCVFKTKPDKQVSKNDKNDEKSVMSGLEEKAKGRLTN